MNASNDLADSIQRGVSHAGAPGRFLIVGAIRAYRVTLGRLLPNRCRFYPSCSHYAEEAVRTHGVLKGTALAVWRLLRCQPFAKGGFDNVPARKPQRSAKKYDTVLRTGRGA